MPLSLTIRNGVYQVIGTHQGRRVRQSAGTSDRAEAEAVRVKIESEVFKRAIFGDHAVATFAEAADGYLDAHGSPDFLTPLILEWGAKKLADIDQALFDKTAKKLKPHAANATLIRQIYGPGLAVMNHAATQGLCPALKLKKPKVKKGRINWLTPDEADAWIEALERTPALRGLFVFLLGEGCRIGEALKLVWKDVMPGDDRGVLWETKKDYSRGVDIQERVRMMLPPGKREPAAKVFLNSYGVPWHGPAAINLRLKQMRAQRDRAIAKQVKAGVPEADRLPTLVRVHNHMLRHTWATWAYACTRNIHLLMSQGGWRDSDMVLNYAHTASDRLAREIIAHGWRFSGHELPGLVVDLPILAPTLAVDDGVLEGQLELVF